MGKIILCGGKQSKEPFRPDYTGRKLYSAEELCYYIGHNLYSVEAAFFSEELCTWLSEECGLPVAAEKLEAVLREGGTVKEMAVAVLCASDYYTETEIRQMIRKIEEFENLPVWRRKKLLADDYIRSGKYREAKTEYEKLLQGKEAAGLTAEDHGNILHSIGVAEIYTASYREAGESFLSAYRQNRSQEYLKHCLYAYKLGGLTAEYRKVTEEESVPYETGAAVTADIMEAQQESEETAEYKALQRIFAARKDGYVNEYNQRVTDTIDSWKAEYRKGAL